MVPALGFEPSLRDPQSLVLTYNTKRAYWLGNKDSNLGHPESESGVLPTELFPNLGGQTGT